MQDLQAVLDVIQEKGLNVQQFSRETGIPSARIYKWRAGEGAPKVEDVGKIQNWLRKTSINQKKTEEIPSPTNPATDTQMEIINKLANSNNTLAEANKRLADAHYIIAKNNEDLIKMIKPNATDEDLREIVRAFGTKLAAVEDVFSVELTKGKKDEIARIREALHKREDEIQNLVQQIGNSVNTGI